MLGNDFPKAEIDSIIKEADITMDGKISYSEFLALWEDKNEEKHQHDIQQIREILATHDSERSSSVMSDDLTDDGLGVVSRANFLDGKRTSERRANEKTQENGRKRVGFNEEVRTIPTVTFAEGELPVMNDDSETMKLKSGSV